MADDENRPDGKDDVEAHGEALDGEALGEAIAPARSEDDEPDVEAHGEAIEGETMGEALGEAI